MERTDLISERQLAVLAFVGLMSPLIRMMPRSAVILGGKAAWLSPAVAAAVGAAYLALLRYFTKNRGTREGLYELSIRCLGGAGGKIFSAVCALWITFYAGFLSRNAAERLLSSIYTDGNTYVFTSLLLASAAAAAAGKTRSLARAAEVSVPVIIGIFAFVILSALPDIKADRLLPVTYLDAGSICLGSLPIIDIIGAFSYFLFLYNHVEKKPGEGRQPLIWMLLQMLIILGVMIVTVGYCGAELSMKLNSAFYIVIRNISILGVVERIEAVVITIWIITDLALISAMLMTGSEICRCVFGTGRRAPFVWPLAAGAAAAAFTASSNALDLQRWSGLIVPAVNLLFTLVLIPAVLFIGKLRKKI